MIVPPSDSDAERAIGDSPNLVNLFYRDFYQAVFNEEGFVGWSYRKTHREVEKGQHHRNKRVLEIGAGSGQHLRFVKDDFMTYTMLDLFAEPRENSWSADERISWIQGDVCDISAVSGPFDRIIAMCVLHHLHDPQAALENIRDWLRPGGVFTFFLPSDPGFLNRLNRALFVSRRSRRLGFPDYEVFNAREHRNHYWGLKEELNYTFRGYDVQRRYWPFRIPLADLSLFPIWSIRKPKALEEID